MCEALNQPAVAAVTLSGCGRTLTSLGVPAWRKPEPSNSNDANQRVLYAPAGLAVFHRERVLKAGGIDASLVYGHEDANLGWRLALRGFRTVEIDAGLDVDSLAPPAVMGARDPIAEATRLRHVTAKIGRASCRERVEV